MADLLNFLLVQFTYLNANFYYANENVCPPTSSDKWSSTILDLPCSN